VKSSPSFWGADARSTLSHALDAHWLTANLSPHLWRDDECPGEVVRVEIRDTWVSLQGLTALYEVYLRDRDGGVVRQLYVGHEVIPDHFDKEYETLLRTALTPPKLGRAAVPFVEANLILLAFPNARRMRPLSEQELRHWLTAHIEALIGKRLGTKRWQLEQATLDVVNYVPDRRLTMRCRCHIVAEDDSEGHVSFIAKQFRSRKKAERLYRSLAALERSWRAPSVSFPKALAFDNDRAIVFMEELPGKDLRRAASETGLGQVLPAVGRLLANFHRAPTRVRRRVSIGSELEAVNGALRIVTRTFPNMHERVQDCLSALKAVQWSDDMPAVLLHGAYRLSHILQSDGKLALVDLDSIRMGHPGYDLGKFLAYLYYMESLGQIDASDRRDAARKFLEAYAAAAPWRISPAAVLWFLASELMIKQTKKDLMQPHADRSVRVDRALTLAETTLAAARDSRGDCALPEVCAAIP
jgi:aminoglycoside phosphotransferase (APT) family kinase protein